MDKLLKLKDDLKFHLRTCEEIVSKVEAENRAMADDEKARFDDAKAKAEATKAEITKLEDSKQAADDVRRELAALETPEARKVSQGQPADDTKAAKKPRIEFKKYGKLKAYDSEENAYRVGQWMRGELFNDAKARAWCKDNGVYAATGHIEGDNARGGALVPEEFVATLVNLREEYGVFRRETMVLPMSSDKLIWPRKTGDISGSWVGEGMEIPEDNATFDNLTLVAKKRAVITRVSSELSEDAVISLAEIVTQDVARDFALSEDKAGFVGDGTSTYAGIVGIATKLEGDNALAGHVTAKASHDTLEEVDAADIARVIGALPQFASINAKFYCSQQAYAMIFERLLIGAGGNTWSDVNGRPTPSYAGYPIVISQVLENSLSTINGTHMLLFGDLSMATKLGDRRQITLSTSDQAYWKYDQIGIRATQRIDINCHEVGTTTQAGPVVALIGKTS